MRVTQRQQNNPDSLETQGMEYSKVQRGEQLHNKLLCKHTVMALDEASQLNKFSALYPRIR